MMGFGSIRPQYVPSLRKRVLGKADAAQCLWDPARPNGGLALGYEGAASGTAGDRVPEQRLAARVREVPHGFSAGPQGGGFRRWAKCVHGLSVGGGPFR